MGQWDSIKSRSVNSGLRRGLLDDGRLSHSEVVDLIRATLDDGIVTDDELADLTTVADKSRSIPVRSRSMLQGFVSRVHSTVGGRGPFSLSSPQQMFAADMVCDFLRRSGRSAFPNLDRDDVGIGLLMRIANPGVIRQGDSSLCGPTALVFNVASDQPVQYARYAIDLYEKGKATIGRLSVEPRKVVRSYSPPIGSIHPTDWLTTASLRDSENGFFPYGSVEKEFAGMTLPGDLADWFRKAGYSDVREETNLKFTKGAGAIDDANRLYGDHYHVCLFINSQMLKAKEQTESSHVPDHWVVLRSPITRSGGKVRLTVFTWGQGDYQIPKGDDLSEGDFLNNFYGHVAAKA
jgi:hypothetical protein